MNGNLAVSIHGAALAVLVSSGLAMAADTGPIARQIDWPTFMRRQDMTFDKLPRSWKEAPHFGNAMVGSMLYRDENTLKLQVFRADVHDHRDNSRGWTAYTGPVSRSAIFRSTPSASSPAASGGRTCGTPSLPGPLRPTGARSGSAISPMPWTWRSSPN